MQSFALWLHHNTSDDDGIRALQMVRERNPEQWPWQSNRLDDYLKFIRDYPSDSVDKDIEQMRTAFASWNKTHNGFMRQAIAAISDNFGRFAMGVGGMFVLAILAYALLNQSLLKTVAQPEVARAMITIMFCIGVVAVALLIAVAAFWAPIDQLDQRFDKAKDLLTVLVGIFGTILGFYFGQASMENRADNAASVAIEQQTLDTE